VTHSLPTERGAGVHEAVGFTPLGVLRRVGHKVST
jgi:hypothetical protein